MEIHPTAVKEETGFSVLEMLLSLIIVGLLAFIGLYVYQTQKNASDTYSAASKAAQANAPKTIKKATASTDRTASWLLYTSPGNEYSIRLADGWKFERYQKTSAIYSGTNANLTPKPGTKATITEVQGGKDGVVEGMSVWYSRDSTDYTVKDYNLVATAKTNDGLTYHAYTKTQTSASNELGDFDNGGTFYRYIVFKPGTATAIIIDYGAPKGQTDYHADVEASVQTLTLK